MVITTLNYSVPGGFKSFSLLNGLWAFPSLMVFGELLHCVRLQAIKTSEHINITHQSQTFRWTVLKLICL